MRRIPSILTVAAVLAAAVGVSTGIALAAGPTAPYNVFTIEENENGHRQVDAATATTSGGVFQISGTDDSGDQDSISLAPPTGSQFAVGTYALVGGQPDATHVGFSMTTASSTCDSGTGSITIDQVTENASHTVTALAATYTNGCGGIHTKEAGAIRFNSNLGFVAVNEGGSVDFGEHYFGEFTPATLTIQNTGSQALVMGQMQKSGTQVDTFAITADTCSGKSVAVGASCKITVDPQPTAPGLGSLDIQIPDNSPLGDRYGQFSYRADYSPIGTYRYVGSRRMLDTRHGIGAPQHSIAPGQTLSLQVANRGDVPSSGASAVVLNLTATNTRSNGFVTVFPSGTSRPTVSNLNYTVGTTRANSVTVALGSNGAINLYNGSAGSVDLIVDVSGYFLGQDNMLAGGAYHPIVLSRILDTRNQLGALKAQYQIFLPFTFNHSGQPDIDSHVSAVAVNITAVNPTAAGYLSIDGGTTSVLNFAKGQTVPNMAVLQTNHCMSSECLNMPYITITNMQSTGSTHVLVDVIGYYDDGSLDNGLRFHPISPVRITDTRTNLGAAPIGPGKTATIAPKASLLDNDTFALALNVTAVAPTTSTYLTVWSGGTRPTSSTLNPAAKQTVANATITLLSDGGTFNVFNAGGTTNLCVDVAGTYELYPYSHTAPTAKGPDAAATRAQPIIRQAHS